jgi:TctA family transporter
MEKPLMGAIQSIHGFVIMDGTMTLAFVCLYFLGRDSVSDTFRTFATSAASSGFVIMAIWGWCNFGLLNIISELINHNSSFKLIALYFDVAMVVTYVVPVLCLIYLVRVGPKAFSPQNNQA